MIPYETIIQLDRTAKQPVYVQLSNALIELIKNGQLIPGGALPGSRILADKLSLHRKTVVAAYDELVLQGWLETFPQKGTFVNRKLPIQAYRDFLDKDFNQDLNEANFAFRSIETQEEKQVDESKGFMKIDDGVSDVRLAPHNEIGRIYRALAAEKFSSRLLSYGTTFGSEALRKSLVKYLNETRGLRLSKENILITRGSQMGIFLSAELLINPNDVAVVGETNYINVEDTFLHRGAQLKRVPVDEHGISVDAIAQLAKTTKIRLVYVTSHHHHPTTVTMSAARRIQLLNLAQEHQFAILEDDYDYDFNYDQAPILPLASHDKKGNVIYVGSVCKTVAPAFRVGYLIASADFVASCAAKRRFVDRQGDFLLEHAFARFIQAGSLDKHIRKVLKLYKERRDHFCALLKEELPTQVSFEIPRGGMAIWLKLNGGLKWKDVATEGLKHGILIENWAKYDRALANHNSIRVGFASMTELEAKELIKRLKESILNTPNNITSGNLQ